jgi:transcriptional regulator with XRE-family HTH domain
MDMRKLVGRNFARIRRAKGLTQEQVEERSGFSQQYLSGLERGRRNPTIVTLFELAQALGVSHVDLVSPDAGIEDDRRTSARPASTRRRSTRAR